MCIRDRLTIIIIFALSKSGLFSDTPTGAFIGSEDRENSEINKNQETFDAADKSTVEKKKTEYNNLLMKILELRDASKTDPIKQAELVTEIDDVVSLLDNNPVTDQWETTTLCLADKCTDNDFFDLIITIALEGDKEGISYGNLIVNLLTANKYWNTDNVVKFSQAMTSANALITELNDEAITSKWHEIVDCDGGCAEKNELNFEMIKLIVQ